MRVFIAFMFLEACQEEMCVLVVPCSIWVPNCLRFKGLHAIPMLGRCPYIMEKKLKTKHTPLRQMQTIHKNFCTEIDK